MKEEFLSVRDVARRFRVCERTVLSWIRGAQLPAVRFSKKYLIPAAAVEHFISSHPAREAANAGKGTQG